MKEDPLAKNSRVLGEKPDFWEKWDEHSSSMYDLCLMLMKGMVEIAADVHHAAMLKAFEAWPDLGEGIENPGAWLYSLTYNACRDHFRKRNRQPEEGLQGRESFQGRLTGPCNQESPEDELLRREMYQNLRSAIDQLPERIRKPALLRWLQNMPYREIARQLNLSSTNVRKRVQEGRGMIRESLRLYLEQDGGMEGELRMPQKDAEIIREILEASPGELSFHQEWLQGVCVSDRAGNIRRVFLVLEKKPNRIRQKQESLVAYLDKHPGGWKKELELAEIYLVQGKWIEAFAHLEQVFEKQAQNFQARLWGLEICRVMGWQQRGLELCRGALPYVRSDAARMYFHAWTEWFKGNWRVASTFFEKAAGLDRGVSEYFRRMVQCHLQGGEEAQALWICLHCLEQGIQDPWLNYMGFCLAWKRGQTSVCRDLCGLFERRLPRHLIGKWMEAMLDLFSEENKSQKLVKKILKQVDADEPFRLIATDLRIRQYLQENELTEARSYVRSLISTEMQDREMLGMALKWSLRLGVLDTCTPFLESVKQGFADDPCLVERALLVLAWLPGVDLTPWLGVLEESHPDNLGLHLQLARAFARRGETDKVFLSLSEKEEEISRDARLLSIFADILIIMGESERAGRLLKKAWRLLTPDQNPRLAARIAWQRSAIYQKLAKTASARNWQAELREILPLLEESSPGLYHFYRTFLEGEVSLSGGGACPFVYYPLSHRLGGK